ncbi:MAG: flagellar hook-basal body complex protein [Paracoccaceae bacterium]
MDNATYVTLTRQSGLLREMQLVANNIANASTTGFRREGLVFAEHVAALGPDEPSLSMAHASARAVYLNGGELTLTGGPLDFAIEGEGFFLIDTAGGQRLSRAGSFSTSAEGLLVDAMGNRLLDAGGAPVFLPPDASAVTLSPDGTLAADGVPVAQVGLWQPLSKTDLVHEAGTLFRADGELVPVQDSKLRQGFLEGSNVEPVAELARMVEVQRAYELGQSFLEREDERVRGVISTLGR